MRLYLQVYRLVLQGRVDEVRRMLSVHTQSGSEVFRSLDEILRKMPLFSAVSHVLLVLPPGEGLL